MSALGSLLTRIHGSSQFQMQHGLTKAIEEAEKVVVKLRDENSRLTQALDKETQYFAQQERKEKLRVALDLCVTKAIEILTTVKAL